MRIGILGVKLNTALANTSECPAVKMVTMLRMRGYDVRIYDPTMRSEDAIGFPQIRTALTSDFDDFLAHADTIAVGSESPEVRTLLNHCGKDRVVLDFAHFLGRRTGKRLAA